jgi:hypothetical protein
MHNNSGTIIKKASGEAQLFDISKLKRSLENAGADKDVIDEIATDIQQWLQDGVTTKKIYARAYKLLHRKNWGSALRYKLKNALIQMGPTGYPFERFIGEIFKKLGYHTEVGQIIEGRCITHEVDVIATKDHTQNLVECKFAQNQGSRIGVQVPLYVRSRVDDIVEKRRQMPEFKDMTFSGWIVTNNRFSSDSIEYGKCIGLHLLAWDYPQGNGLKDIILKENVFPITLLNHLTLKEKQELIEKGIVTCAQLLADEKMLSSLEHGTKNYRHLLRELSVICHQR